MCEPFSKFDTFAIRVRQGEPESISSAKSLTEVNMRRDNEELIMTSNSTERCMMNPKKNNTFTVVLGCGENFVEPHLIDNPDDKCD